MMSSSVSSPPGIPRTDVNSSPRILSDGNRVDCLDSAMSPVDPLVAMVAKVISESSAWCGLVSGADGSLCIPRDEKPLRWREIFL